VGAVGIAAAIHLQSNNVANASVGIATVADGANLKLLKAEVIAAAKDIQKQISSSEPPPIL
jgi:hypothetical protein